MRAATHCLLAATLALASCLPAIAWAQPVAGSTRQIVTGLAYQGPGSFAALADLFQFAPRPTLTQQVQGKILFRSMTASGRRSYMALLRHLGIPRALQQGWYYRMAILGPETTTGTASRPTLSYPVRLDQAKSLLGPWQRTDYTLDLTYGMRAGHPVIEHMDLTEVQ